MEFLSENTPAVAEPVDTAVEEATGTVESENTPAVAEPVDTQGEETLENAETEVLAPKQSREQNAQFAQIRREKEFKTSLADDEYLGFVNPYTNEIIRTKADQIAYFDALEQDKLSKAGITQESIKEYVKKDPDYVSAQQQLERYPNQEVERMIKSDLEEIQKLDPEIKSIEQLGQEFLDLRCKANIPAKTAFLVLKEQGKYDKAQTPEQIGKINSAESVERDYYTSSELDALTSKDLDDPKIMAKALKSMSKLRKG